MIRKICLLCAILLLSACAGNDGRGLQPGIAQIDEVVAQMGPPALRWQDPDGSQQLAFPRGPQGVHTFMAFFGPDQRLIRLENVLDTRHFAQIRPDKHDQNDILRLLGPPNPAWTVFFKARNELVWEWLFCDDWNQLARFDVLFDASTGIVRTTYQRPDLRGPMAIAPVCSR